MPIDKICVICSKPFQCRDAPNTGSHGARSLVLRPFKAMTCNKECSKIHCKNLQKNWQVVYKQRKEAKEQ
jgi:hypothetical protein